MKYIHLINKKLLFIIFTILLFGMIMVLSASYPKYGMYYFYKQISFVGAGIIISMPLIFGWWKIDMYTLKKNSLILYSLTLALLIIVFAPIDGNTVNGSTRWITFPWFKFQPSEMAKLTIIIIMATMISDKEIRDYWGTLKTFFLVSAIAFLLLLETDFGATIMIAGTAFIMIFVAGTRVGYLFITIVISSIVLAILVYLTDNRLDRIIAFFQSSGEMDMQRFNAMIGIVRGGFFGSGIGASLQKINILPEAHNDMIFAIIGEETGMFGMLALVLAFSYIFYKGFMISQIAIKRGRKFQSSMAFGISTILSAQTLLNLSVNLSLIPPKGITLPLVSYGGSSMVFTIIMLAILLKIDMENKIR